MNFKSLRDVTIEFAPRFTVFIGENGSGKSSVLQFLAMLKQSDLPNIKSNGDEINLYELKDHVFDDSHDISFELIGEKCFSINDKESSITLNYEVLCTIKDTRIAINKFELSNNVDKIDLVSDSEKTFIIDDKAINIRREKLKDISSDLSFVISTQYYTKSDVTL